MLYYYQIISRNSSKIKGKLMIIYNFIKYLILSIRYQRIIQKVYQEDGLLTNFSKLFGSELKQDWIGRVYTIINPWIRDGKYDPTSAVYELGQNGPSYQSVEKYIMDRLNIAQKFIRTNNLFDLLTYKLERLDEYENYLFVMYPIPYIDLAKWSKYFGYLLVVLIIIGIILCLCL